MSQWDRKDTVGCLGLLLIVIPGVLWMLLSTSEGRTGLQVGLFASLVIIALIVGFCHWLKISPNIVPFALGLMLLGVVLGAIVGEVVGSNRWAPFEALLHKYSNRRWKSFPSAPGQAYLHGKLLVASGLQEQFYKTLDTSLVPTKPEEVGSILYVDCHQEKIEDQAYFRNGGDDKHRGAPIFQAFRQACECVLIDTRSDTQIARTTLYGPDPPAMVSGRQGGETPDTTGGRVDDGAVATYLEGLPRQ